MGHMKTDPLSQPAHRCSFARLRYAIPLAVCALLLVFLGIGLSLNPREVPSPLVGKPVPVFDLPAVKGRTLGLSNRDLVGQVSLVNVFASWCVACRRRGRGPMPATSVTRPMRSPRRSCAALARACRTRSALPASG